MAELEEELRELRATAFLSNAGGRRDFSQGQRQKESATKLLENIHPADALLLRQTQDAVAFCDSEYRIVYVNEAYVRLFGWSSEEAIGRHPTFRLPPLAREEFEGYLSNVIKGVPFKSEWQDYRRDGTRIWVNWRAQRVLDSSGRLAGTINIATDISDLKIAQYEREQLQRQLFQAQKMDTLGTLAGGIAHDLNNILAVIFGFTELALAGGARGTQTVVAHQEVLKATERGRDLVKRILSFSRFHEPERRPVRLSAVLEDAVKFIRATLPTTVNVVVDVPLECPLTLADPHQIHQVLLNVATNAAHALSNEEGTIKLSLSSLEVKEPRDTNTGTLRAGKYLAIETADNGIGMSRETQHRIFEPFFTTKNEGEGTGLGLSVVKAIISSHGGAIEVKSEVGEGAVFTIFIPLLADVNAPQPEILELSCPGAKDETVAIIDDEDVMVSITEKLCQNLGYTTLAFNSAEKFLNFYMTEYVHIDMVITDQTMPGMTGIQLARKLRAAGYTLPVLFMSGFSRHLRPEVVDEIGRAGLVRKPFDQALLARSLRELLDTAAQPVSPVS